MSAPRSKTITFHMIEAVAEGLEGAPRQVPRRWSDAFKAQVVAEAPEPGASVSAIAHRVGIHPSQLFAWRPDAWDGPTCAIAAFELRNTGAVCGGRGGRGRHWRHCRARRPDVDEAHLQPVIRAVRSA
ncbi:transposase [Ensifer aridi]|uniref:transposase n=1 Tax=Ensifer aridi TaxID=1708715 RepID=UPI0009BFB51C